MMKRASPLPAQLSEFPWFLPAPTLLLSPITYIFQYPKSYKVYMNMTYKDAASFPGWGEDGVLA